VVSFASRDGVAAVPSATLDLRHRKSSGTTITSFWRALDRVKYTVSIAERERKKRVQRTEVDS